MNRPNLIKYFPKETTIKKVHKTYLKDMPLYSYAVALDEYIDYLEDELSSLRGGNELGVSDVAAKHNALHEVGKNEQTKDVCIDGRKHPHHVLYCDKCKNWYNNKLVN